MRTAARQDTARRERGICLSMPRLAPTLALLVGTALFPITNAAAQRLPPVVRAVLFFSPTCPHCHQVINEDLPVIFERFGGTPRVWVDQRVPRDQIAFYYVTNGSLEILLVDASKPAGGQYYEQTTSQFEIPYERSGVPRLIIGDSVLVGSLEIPQVFPVLIQQATANGGIDWPAIEGLREHIPAIPPEPAVVAQAPDSAADSIAAPPAPPKPSGTRATADTAPRSPTGAAPPTDTAGIRSPDGISDTAPAEPLPSSVDTGVTPGARGANQGGLGDIPMNRASMLDNFKQDPVANGASVVVLVAMILSVLIIGRRAAEWTGGRGFGTAVPLLAVVGIVVAGYLTYVETSGALAVCGPVGDCNAVQQSPYARLFGVVPVGLLGLMGYVIVIVGWFAGRTGRERMADGARLVVFGVAFVGTVFSIYLTFLEPFVIGATCAWCLTSSLVITALLWLTAGPGTAAWVRITTRGRPPA